MTQNTDQERAEFEALFKHLDLTQEPDAWGVPRYKHGVISLAWEAWQAARRAPAEPVISEAQVLAITTAYEQGVGKGHQSHARKEAITNPYGDEWGCDSAWQMGYDEGREQAERKAERKAESQWDGVIKPSDFIVDTFRSAGSGWVPNPDNCVRIVHRPTGLFEEETAMRSVHANKAAAWQRLSARLESLAAAPQPQDAAQPNSPEFDGIKPEVLAWRWRKPIVNDQGETIGTSAWEYGAAPGFLPWWTNDPLIRLIDYEALQAQCENLRADAERYRWLRDNDWNADKELESVIRLQLNAIWDVKIDEAMAAQAKQGGEHA